MRVKLIVGLVIVFIAGVLFYWFGYKPATTLPTTASRSNLAEKVTPNSQEIGAQEQVIAPRTSPSSTELKALADRITTLEATVTKMQEQVTELKQSKAAGISQAKATKSPLYIPVSAAGNTGEAVHTYWYTLDLPTVTINSADYESYKSAQLEMNLLVFEGSGKASVRLIDSATNGLIIPESEVSTTSYAYTFVQSKPFRLLEGNHTYKLQVNSTTGYPVYFTSVNIKVNF